jgi:hypothetical protein
MFELMVISSAGDSQSPVNLSLVKEKFKLLWRYWLRRMKENHQELQTGTDYFRSTIPTFTTIFSGQETECAPESVWTLSNKQLN